VGRTDRPNEDGMASHTTVAPKLKGSSEGPTRLSFRTRVATCPRMPGACGCAPASAGGAFTVEAKKGYKLKTNKAAAKRFRVTGSGKVMRRNPMKQHLLEKKSSGRKRQLSNAVVVNDADINNIIGMMPLAKITQ